ncbi:MAG: acetyl-CoA carboxylase biotin carboxyl carrier protein subunit [Candidatus Kapabacteria bacterium]|nr:acetyl-CoA carboxylase biotin carboxyl carrier protein subunit [Candidatus Kapabacteria bacterium]
MNDINNLNEFIIDDTVYKTRINKKYSLKKQYKPKDNSIISAFIPGTIRKIYVSEGQKVNRGDKLLVLEAMKMKNDIVSPINAKVKSINVKVDEVVTKNQLLIELET